MIIKKFTLTDSVKDLGLHKCLVVRFLSGFSGNYRLRSDIQPSTKHLHNLEALEVEPNVFHLLYNGKPRKVLLKADRAINGCDWVLRSDMSENPRNIYCLVVADPNKDHYHENPAIEVTEFGDAVLIDASVSEVNEQPIFEASPAGEFKKPGFDYTIRNVKTDRRQRDSVLLAHNGKKQDGSSRPTGKLMLKIGGEALPIADDVTTDAEILTGGFVDYNIAESELLDSDSEYLTMWPKYGGKVTGTPLTINLNVL